MKKILLVDDEENICFFTKKNLEESGDFRVEVCSDSEKAMSAAKRLKPDVIILDIMMPGISGVELAMKLRSDKSTRHIPCIFLSGLLKEEGVEKYKQLAGDSHIISKPVKTGELIDIINEVVSEEQPAAGGVKDKIRTVTFLSRRQVDFLNKLGNDALFHHGSKLSRTQILSEMINLLMELEIDIKDINLKETTLSKGVSKIIKNKQGHIPFTP